VESLAANVSPTWFLLLARVWPTVALIAVPFGTVTIVAGCDALLETLAAFGGSAFSGVAAASLVAWFEQPATVKNAAAAASQSLRWNRVSIISLLLRDYPGSESKEVAGLSPSPGKSSKPANGGYSLLA
jgi:hypothetical protein